MPPPDQLVLFELAAPGEKKRKSRRCECGQAKTADAEGCERCMFLDGETLQDHVLVDALRKREGIATTEELEQESGWSHRQVLRALERLKASQRVVRLETGAENHANMPTFILTNEFAPRRLVDDRDPWGQLVLAAWTNMCRHVRLEAITLDGGRIVGQRCLVCGARQIGGQDPFTGERGAYAAVDIALVCGHA
jgi:hypothetical protein